MAKRVKLADIAREAGVSVTAASFYINGKGEVVVMEKFVVPYKLFDATATKSGCWFF